MYKDFPVFIPFKEKHERGWECPKCEMVMAPFMTYCTNCLRLAKRKPFTNGGPNTMSRPYVPSGMTYGSLQ